MKLLSFFIVIFTAVFMSGCVGFAHKEPRDVSDLEIGIYKAGITMGCKDQGKKSSDPSRNDRFCDCVMSTLSTSMTRAEWQLATSYAQQRKSKEEDAVHAPHMSSTVSACRAATN